jgi:hypothetical protein
MTKCSAIDRNLKGCRCNAINDTSFCKKHDYMVDYTEEMLSNLQICSGCKKSYYIPDGKTCSSCRNRGKQNKQISRENVVFCANDKCVFKRSEENKYCQKHQLCIFVDETVAINKKVCKNYVRGCRSQLDLDYQYIRCQSCLEKEREQERNRRANTKNTTHTDTHQTCTTCCQELENSLFVGVNGGNTKTCKNCRESNRIQDQKRDKEHRNELARIAEKKPERKEVKQQWNENNYEKVAMKSMNYRQRQIETDVEGYLNKNSENAKQWRENNPEKVKNNNQNKINNINLQYGVYSRCAGDKNLDFEISQEEFNKIATEPCHYCDIIQERGFNGIDRLDSNAGYVLDNCVSCCKTCNYMKCSLPVDVFLKRIEHILTYNNKINGRYFPEEFCDTDAASYNRYKTRANNKSLPFDLTKDEYDSIVTSQCYLCGRKSYEKHKNGIDRIDNNLGYIMSNVKPCCGSCNYIKKDMELTELFNKMTEIFLKCKIKVETVTIVNKTCKPSKNIVKNTNKKTPEEIRENARIRKQQQRERLKEKYGDDEYKKKHAQEISDYRKSKKETNN